jgi:hypothetical protein
MLSIIVGMADRYARCAAVLYRMFRGLDMITLDKREFQRQWDETMQSGDSVAMITWCAKRFNWWSDDKYLDMVRTARAREIVPDMSGRTPEKIMSPDRKTDWTTAVWWIHYQIDSQLPFTHDVLSRMEECLEQVYPMEEYGAIDATHASLTALLARLRLGSINHVVVE